MNKVLKAITIVACAAMLVAGSVAATLAYIATKTNPITNTFVAGDVTITLTETTGSDYTMVPGTTIEKDPIITVSQGSEKCWLFVKVTETEHFDTYLSYSMDASWTTYAGEEGVYYCLVDAKNAEQIVHVLENDEITANANCTKEQYNDIIASGNKPTLTFTAYAVQYVGFEETVDNYIESAWTVAKAAQVATP